MTSPFKKLQKQYSDLKSQVYTAALEAIEAIPALCSTGDKRLVFDEPLQPHDDDDEFLIAGLRWFQVDAEEPMEIQPFRADDGSKEFLYNLNTEAQLCLIQRLEEGRYTIQRENEPEPDPEHDRYEGYREKGKLDENVPVYTNREHMKGQAEGVYLCLWHGFTSPEARQEADDWGDNGPMIGPLRYCQTTYGAHVKFEFADEFDALPYGLKHSDDLIVDDNGCLLYAGMQYGDWSVFYHKPKAQ